MLSSIKAIPFIILAVAFSSAGCGGEGTGDSGDKFSVVGVSGQEIVLDRMWDRGCIPGAAEGVWLHDERTLTGLTLVTTIVEYDNGSKTADCKTGKASTIVFTQELTNDHTMIDITWVGPDNMPAAAPPGLESVKQANAATGLVTSATRTPETEESAALDNMNKFWGLDTWKAGVATDVVAIITQGVNPARGTIVVDDRATPWKVYDGNSIDPSKYPTEMPNYLPHQGPY